MTEAIVYFDHPVHYASGHALLIDVLSPAKGPSARVALELSPTSARSLAEAILRALDTAPVEQNWGDGVADTRAAGVSGPL